MNEQANRSSWDFLSYCPACGVEVESTSVREIRKDTSDKGTGTGQCDKPLLQVNVNFVSSFPCLLPVCVSPGR